MEGARLPPLSQMGDDGKWCFTGLHRRHQAASYTPDDDARPRTSNPKRQMSCPRKGTSSHIPLYKTWKQTQKKKSKARSQIKTRTSPHPKQPTHQSTPKRWRRQLSGPPKSPARHCLFSRHVPDTFRPAAGGAGQACAREPPNWAPADGSSLGR